MKMHRFFAWMTVVCFLLTMVTGYKKKQGINAAIKYS